jgi:hypothetical protein
MKSITDGNLLLGRLFNAAPSAVPLPAVPPTPAAPPAVAATPPSDVPFDTLPAGVTVDAKTANFLRQADAAAAMSIPVPPGFVPAGTGALADTFIQAPLTEASLPGWEDAVAVIQTGDLTAILALLKSVSPAMAALLMNHILPLPNLNKADMLRRLILAASNDILLDPDDEPLIDTYEEE